MNDPEPTAKPVPLYDVATDRERVEFLIITAWGLLALGQVFVQSNLILKIGGVFIFAFAVTRVVSMTRSMLRRRAETGE